VISPAAPLRTDGALQGRLVRLEPLAEHHRERLREEAADVSLFRYMA
jgi:hypothetical protein